MDYKNMNMTDYQIMEQLYMLHYIEWSAGMHEKPDWRNYLYSPDNAAAVRRRAETRINRLRRQP